MVLKAKKREVGRKSQRCDDINSSKAYKKMWSAVVTKKSQVNMYILMFMKINSLVDIVHMISF